MNGARLLAALSAALTFALASLPDGASPWANYGLGIAAAFVAVLAGEARSARQP